MARPLPRYLALYAAMFAAFGAASPFVPTLLAAKGLALTPIGLVMGAATAIRLVAGPLGGSVTDRVRAPERVLAALQIGAGAALVAYVPAAGVRALLGVGVAVAAMEAPLVPIADALALAAADGERRFHYGHVRAAGSAAFVAGTVFSGFAMARFGPAAFVWLSAGLLAVAAMAARRLPRAPSRAPAHTTGGMLALLRLPGLARLLLIAALVQGSHAMHDSFAVIRWEAGGIGPAGAGLLWSEAVIAEVVVFVWLGGWLLGRLGPAGAATLAAVAGVLRWSVMALTAWPPAMALIEPLHGATFALLHLACMRLIGEGVPSDLAARAQALYGTVAIGAATVALTLLSGPLYAALGAHAFLAMALLCGLAVPLARGLLPLG